MTEKLKPKLNKSINNRINLDKKGHHHKDADEKKDDKLHHDHENFSQYEKILLMSVVGGILFACDIVFLLLNFSNFPLFFVHYLHYIFVYLRLSSI